MNKSFTVNLNKVAFGQWIVNGAMTIDPDGYIMYGSRFYLYGPNGERSMLAPIGYTLGTVCDIIMGRGTELTVEGKLYSGSTRDGLIEIKPVFLQVAGAPVFGFDPNEEENQ